jgi:hypothetical protein
MVQGPEKLLTEELSINKDKEDEENVEEEEKDNFKLQQESKEKEKEEPFDCLIRTRFKRTSRPIHKYVTTHHDLID